LIALNFRPTGAHESLQIKINTKYFFTQTVTRLAGIQSTGNHQSEMPPKSKDSVEYLTLLLCYSAVKNTQLNGDLAVYITLQNGNSVV